MNIGVIGHGHFAGVVAACLAARDLRRQVQQFDFEPRLIRADQRQASDEPGWSALMSETVNAKPFALTESDLVWIAYDVPLDDRGAPVVDEILARIQRLDADVPKSIPFLVSCQWPVGTTRKIAALCPGREFVYVMENVRAGKAIADFTACGFPALGHRDGPANVDTNPLPTVVWHLGDTLGFLKNPLTMSWESAEFGKHAMNAFIALQIAFVNELARLAPEGVDMADVTRVLKADARVSPHAPLTAGAPFGGGSLKRDLLVLNALAHGPNSLYTPILDAIVPSNEA